MARSWGYRADPPDARDRTFRMLIGHQASLAAPPSSASVEDTRVGPKDQGSTGSCTGQAWSQALRLSYLRAGIACPELSALFSYFSNRAEFGEQAIDEGAYLRTGAAAAVKFGIAAESAWPFSEANVNLEPGFSAFRSAHDRRGVRSYHRVNLAVPDDVRRAIAAGYAVVGGWDVDESFEAFDGSHPITAPDPKRILGGHALCLTAYESDGTFRFINSCSSDWGVGGYGVTDASWVASGTDGWICDIGGAS